MPDRSAANSPSCPRTILDLIERFELHAETYRRDTYNETQVRREFIDPFFAALGWDMDNESGHAEAYKDVIHEDAIKVGGSTKAPDYCFRIGGVRKFFVEAKKPSVSVGDDPAPAYQLRRYAWTNKLPLSIVTDFEEFAVYDCRIKPRPDDKPSTARVLYLKCEEYSNRWDEIASIFSKDAILKGSFDKFAESNKRKRGTAEVDDEFLKEIEAWRDELARNIALRNPNLSVRDLNYAVGKTIDRLIFLRMCEDRGVETYAQLQILLNGPCVYPRLLEIFYKADQRYNSGLFHFEPEKSRPDPPDNLTPKLTIDDGILKSIIKNLYYPECPYEFSVMPPEILGQVYEQFLGKVITLTAGHRAKVEYKPEVKKAGGVYYTPKYIVDYIVEHTVGKLLADCKTPTDAAKLRILDPACGSGSFLLGAFQTLLAWHLQWFAEHDPEKWAKKKVPPVYQSTIDNRKSTIVLSREGIGNRQLAIGNYRLTITEKKRILLANIYGVDIDPQAVEVTKLSLLLKVLEGESQQTLDNQLRLFHERALPDLGGNIKCGNSLIGPDILENHQYNFLDEEEELRINAFDWKTEFPIVKRSGGFHAVIGNPPYGSFFSDRERRYLTKNNPCFAVYADSFVAFLGAGLDLLRTDGGLGMIVPSTLLGSPKYTGVRSHLLAGARWDYTIVLPYDVFRDAYIDTCIVCFRRDGAASRDYVQTFEFPKRSRVVSLADLSYRRVKQAAWLGDAHHRIVVDPTALTLSASLRKRLGAALGDAIEVRRGVRPLPVHLSQKRTARHRDRYFEGDVYRYSINMLTTRFVAMDETLPEKPEDRRWFDQTRILMRRLVSRKFRLMSCICEKPFVTNKNLYSILPRGDRPLSVILGILNSKLLSYLYIKQVTHATKDDFGQVTIKDLTSMPFPNTVDKDLRVRIGKFVQRMLGLHKQLAAAKTPSDQTAIQRQIDATDRHIDQLVYELYGLTDEEIKIVEEATTK